MDINDLLKAHGIGVLSLSGKQDLINIAKESGYVTNETSDKKYTLHVDADGLYLKEV